jgi:hypothetical protein
MAKLRKLAAAPTEDDARLSEVLRLSLVEGLSIRATRGVGDFADLRQLRLVSDDVR